MASKPQAGKVDPNDIYQQVLRLTILRQIDRKLVDEQEFRNLCDSYAPFKPRTTKHRLAIHESGHAIVLLHFDIVPVLAIVTTEEKSLVQADVEPLTRDSSLASKREFYAYKVAGQVAEELIFGNAKGLEDDVLNFMFLTIMEEITDEERRSLLRISTPAVLRGFAHYQATFALYFEACNLAHKILEPHKQTLCTMAELAEERGFLRAEDIEAIWRDAAGDADRSVM